MSNKPYVVDLKRGLKNFGFNLDPEMDTLYTASVKEERERLAPGNSIRPWYVCHSRPEELKDADATIAASFEKTLI